MTDEQKEAMEHYERVAEKFEGFMDSLNYLSDVLFHVTDFYGEASELRTLMLECSHIENFLRNQNVESIRDVALATQERVRFLTKKFENLEDKEEIERAERLLETLKDYAEKVKDWSNDNTAYWINW